MKEELIGLGLSGGGYRAAAYHPGTLEALNDIKITLCEGQAITAIL